MQRRSILFLVVVVAWGTADALLLREVDGLSGQKLGSKVARGSVVIGIAALPGLAVLELCMGGEEALVVGRATEGFFASCLRIVSWCSEGVGAA